MTQEHIGTKSMAETRAGVKTLAEVMYERALDAFGKDRIDEAYGYALKDIEMAADQGKTEVRLRQRIYLPYDGPMYREIEKRLEENGFKVAYRDTYDPVKQTIGAVYVMW